MKTLIEEMAAYVVNAEYEMVPTEAISAAQYVLFDLLSIGLFVKNNTPWGQTLANYKTSREVPASQALVYGSLFLGYELEDTLTESYLHVGPSAIAVSLAIAGIAPISGKECITAVAAGYQLIGKLGELYGKKMLLAGPHPTAHLTHISSAAIAAKLLKLSEKQTADAIAIASATTSGLVQALDEGSMTRRLFGGLPAQNGIMAALLAHSDFDGPLSALEGKHGLFTVYGVSDSIQISEVVDSFKRNSYLAQFSLKQYACCHAFHGAIDSLLDLKKKYSIQEESIEKITAGIKLINTSHGAANPQTVVAAQYSLPYCLAAAFLHGRLGPHEFTQDMLHDDNISELSSAVKTEFPESLQTMPGFPASLTIHLKDGTTYSAELNHPKGHSSNPLSNEELMAKHNSLMNGIRSPEQSHQLWHSIEHLSEITDISSLNVL